MRYIHKIAKYKDVTVQMVSIYRDRDFGLMVIWDALRGNVLWHKYVSKKALRRHPLEDYHPGHRGRDEGLPVRFLNMDA